MICYTYIQSVKVHVYYSLYLHKTNVKKLVILILLVRKENTLTTRKLKSINFIMCLGYLIFNIHMIPSCK